VLNWTAAEIIPEPDRKSGLDDIGSVLIVEK
jgi:hypothetical protein